MRTSINLLFLGLAAVHLAASTSPPVTVLVGTTRGVFKVIEGSKEEPITLTSRRCYALDYHYANRKIYVATDDKIISLSAESKHSLPSTVVLSDTRITSLAVDWLADVLYYVSDQRGAIRAHTLSAISGSNMDSDSDSDSGASNIVLQADTGVSTPNWNSLAVDPNARKLFWLGSGGLHVSSLGGEDLNVTALTTGRTPFRISLDTHSQRVYVMAGVSGGLILLSCRYDGTGMKELLKIPHIASTVYGFGVIGSVVYWESNFDGENLFKMEILAKGSSASPNITTFYEINKIVSDVKVYHPDLQRPKEDIDTEFASPQTRLRPNEKLQQLL